MYPPWKGFKHIKQISYRDQASGIKASLHLTQRYSGTKPPLLYKALNTRSLIERERVVLIFALVEKGFPLALTTASTNGERERLGF